MTRLLLTDFQSATWKRLTQELEEELQRLRELNDVESQDERKTAFLRGQIKQLKKLLGRAEEARQSPGSPEKALLSAGEPATGDDDQS